MKLQDWTFEADTILFSGSWEIKLINTNGKGNFLHAKVHFHQMKHAENYWNSSLRKPPINIKVIIEYTMRESVKVESVRSN